MSTTLKDKLYNYEVAPPPSTWEGIIAELDESMLTSEFPKTLQQSVAEPPPTTWSLIAASLHADGMSDEYPETLYSIEAKPPVNTWKKIAATLNDAEVVKPLSGKVRSLPFLKYAAAAVLLIAVAYGAFQFFGGSGNTNDFVSTTPPEDQTNAETAIPLDPPSIQSPGTPTSSDDIMNDAALEASKTTYAGLGSSERKRLNRLAEELVYTPADPIYNASEISPQNTYRNPSLANISTAVYTSSNASLDKANRYAMLITPDGQIIRISRKLGTLVCCVSGEEVDDGCVDNLKVWRQRIADSPMAPSPENFLDILSMLQTFKDNTL